MTHSELSRSVESMTASPLTRQNGFAIRTIRQIKGITPKDLAERCGLKHTQSLRNIETEQKSVSEEALNKIAQALDVDAAAIRRLPLSWSIRSVVGVVPVPERQAS